MERGQSLRKNLRTGGSFREKKRGASNKGHRVKNDPKGDKEAPTSGEDNSSNRSTAGSK